MGCFFGCFRVKDDNRPQNHLISDTVSSKSRDALVSRNQLASLLLSEDKEGSPCKDAARHSLGSPLPDANGESDDRELKDEAKFLKACGTLLETPAEIRKTSDKVKDPPPHDEDSNASKFHSWLSATSIKKLHWEEPPVQVPISPVKLRERPGKESGSPEHKPSRNKYVHFECESVSDMEFLPSSGQCLKQSDSPGGLNGSKRSPNPTPLKLTDEIQTPGTVFPANLENLANGMNARIRSEYVYPVLKPVENFCQWKALNEEDSNTHQQIYVQGESIEQRENSSPDCTSVSYSNTPAMTGRKETSGKESKQDASLSLWLKRSSSKHDSDHNWETKFSGRSHSGMTIDQDRPILGTVAAHWNDDEPSHISPKWWDGNGIPNSTNKYKEDQKVSWHATPFEERLEKALSDESLVFQRKNFNISNRPIDFDENEESDTAVSKLQSVTHPESVVSF